VDGPSAADEARPVGLELDARDTIAGDDVRRMQSVAARGRRAKTSPATCGTNSLRMKRFENAGCAASAAGSTSVISAYYYLRIVKVMYFDEPAPAFDRDIGWATATVAAVGTLFSVFFVINAGSLIAAARP